MNNKTIEIIKEQIRTNKIILYMKGTPKFPQCVFSAKAVNCLIKYLKVFKFINVLDNIHIRYELPKLSNWPTFPQLWVNSNLIGGSDIIVEMYKNGELKKIIKNLK
ncbi:Grx4 family monothiol glutaredoxin [Candidatus Portiera aleyrodidarum]|uniref:Glutaredoxin n=1 Tax=Candidatus Portiera aleyrodidarum TV TaxID=1297582 RepID=A0A8D3X8Z7_9GAMM|nr:Grx4 family monothiol glutaredoxin [Candidatus Portiera aleyrodidarum]AGI27218.1 monothiol glutaredoxin, Grx4 family [Candidatus Portiera aleyrodidarum TV]